MKKKLLWTCSDCGGRVVSTCGPGRFYQVRRGVRLAIPNDYETPQCESCGAESLTPEVSGPLDAIMTKVFLEGQMAELKTLVSTLKRHYGVNQGEIEDACRVTRSYLSHLLSGREASGTLMQLIRSFAVSREAFELALGRTTIPTPSVARPSKGYLTLVHSQAGFREGEYEPSASFAGLRATDGECA